MLVWKVFVYKNELVLLAIVIFRKFIYVRESFIWIRKGKVPLLLMYHINEKDRSFFPYGLVTVNNCWYDTLDTANSDVNLSLQTLRKNDLSKLIFARLNIINSIRNNFDSLGDLIKGNSNILMISESKLDNYFPDGHFFLDGFWTPFRPDQHRNSGGVMLSVRNDIPAKVVSADDTFIEDFK